MHADTHAALDDMLLLGVPVLCLGNICPRRVLDVYTGKTAKLNDTALQTAVNTSSYLRYSKADYNLTDIAPSPPIVCPAPNADWSNFSLVNLGGQKTFPIITTAMIVSGSDLSQLGAFFSLACADVNEQT